MASFITAPYSVGLGLSSPIDLLDMIAAVLDRLNGTGLSWRPYLISHRRK
jgi:hypothetical protein